MEAIAKIKFLSGNDLSPIKKHLNRCLYITATHSLRRYRFENELAEFLRGECNRLVTFANFRIEILGELKEIGGYITNRDQRYILSKVIESADCAASEPALLDGFDSGANIRLYNIKIILVVGSYRLQGLFFICAYVYFTVNNASSVVKNSKPYF